MLLRAGSNYSQPNKLLLLFIVFNQNLSTSRKIANQLELCNEKNPFIGLIKSKTSNKWMWIDNNETVLENNTIWKRNRYLNDTNRNCSVLRPTSKIWNRDCTKTRTTGLCEIIKD